ncbi:unnamed protein product, partial [Brenthis ino]
MFLRLLTKQRLFVGFIILVAIVSVLYYNLIFKQHSNGTGQWSGDRCLTELTSIKYQLNVVTEYKNRIDKLLTETEKQHKLDKERFKEIMESCFAMKQQSLLCQSQFEDLQVQCKKVKGDFDKLKGDIEKNKQDH